MPENRRAYNIQQFANFRVAHIINCDLGESFGAYTIGMDAEILPYVLK